MRLYETDEPAWYGTQADAKASGRPFKQREVPTDKPGLLQWLNLNAAPVPRAIVDIRQAEALTTIPPRIDLDATVPIPALAADTVIEWIFDTATPAQIERVFTAMGTRFHEMRKGEAA